MTDFYAIRTDVVGEATITVDASESPLYAELLYGRQAEATLEVVAPPYDGQGPRFVLWGGRERDVQIGSPADTMWRWRRSGTMRLTIPRVRWQ